MPRSAPRKKVTRKGGAAKQATKSAARPAAKPAPRSAPKSAAKPASKPAPEPVSKPALPRGGQYLTFVLAGQEYGIQVQKVQEIIGMREVTQVPRAPLHALGVINLRGRIIPVIDLKRKLDLGATEPAPQSSIIVTEAEGKPTGIVVDRVSEVVDIGEEEIEALPSLGGSQRTGYLLGVGKSHGKVQLLLDIDRALADTDSPQ